MRRAFLIAAVMLLAQAGPQAQARGRGAARPAPAPREATVRVSVHDGDGASLDGAHVTLSGPSADSSAEFTTAGAGLVIMPGLKEGTYRVRAEKAGFVPLEREFTAQGTPLTIDLVLHRQPPAPPPPPKPTAPAAEPQPSGPPVSLVIADFLDREFIGREPMKESIIACKPFETVRLLQMREAVATHAHADVDELVYVVAGEGSAQVGEQAIALKPSTLLVVPRGMAHQFERRGRNPLIVLSTLAGAACEPTPKASK
jgi:hypothetical protein